MLYSKSTRGFYAPHLHGDNVPDDVVEVTDERYAELFAGQSEGKYIEPSSDGLPVLVDPPPLAANDQIKHNIQALEATITPRRIREAILGIDSGWLANVNSQIATLRASLN